VAPIAREDIGFGPFTTFSQVGNEEVMGDLGDRYHAVPIELTPHHHEARVEVDVAHCEARRFTDAEARRIDELEKRPVPQALGGSGIDRFKEASDLRSREGPALEALRLLWAEGEPLRGVFRDQSRSVDAGIEEAYRVETVSHGPGRQRLARPFRCLAREPGMIGHEALLPENTGIRRGALARPAEEALCRVHEDPFRAWHKPPGRAVFREEREGELGDGFTLHGEPPLRIAPTSGDGRRRDCA